MKKLIFFTGLLMSLISLDLKSQAPIINDIMPMTIQSPSTSLSTIYFNVTCTDGSTYSYSGISATKDGAGCNVDLFKVFQSGTFQYTYYKGLNVPKKVYKIEAVAYPNSYPLTSSTLYITHSSYNVIALNYGILISFYPFVERSISVSHDGTTECAKSLITLSGVEFMGAYESLKIRAYPVSSPSTTIGTIYLNSVSSGFSLSQFSSNLTAYYGKDIKFEANYYDGWYFLNSSTVITLPQVTLAQQAPTATITAEDALCNGDKGRLIVQSYSPTNIGSLRIAVKNTTTNIAVANAFIRTGQNIWLPAGNYKYVIYAQDVCVDSTNFPDIKTISEPPALNYSYTPTHEICVNGGGQIVVTPSGGTKFPSPKYYKVELSDYFPITGPGGIEMPNSTDVYTKTTYFDTHEADSLVYIVTRINSVYTPNCNVTITGPDGIHFNNAVNNSYRRYAMVNPVSGSWTVKLSNPSADPTYVVEALLIYNPSATTTTTTTFSGLIAKNYGPIITDKNNCALFNNTDPITLNKGSNPAIGPLSWNAPYCANNISNGSITINLTARPRPGLLKYRILYQNNTVKEFFQSNESPYTIYNRDTGYYRINVEDDKGCISNIHSCYINPYSSGFAIDRVTIDPYKNYNGTIYNYKCKNDGGPTITVFSISPSGTPKYALYYASDSSLASNSPMIAPSPGTYFVKGIDDHFCTVQSNNFNITAPSAQLTFKLDTDKFNGYAISCFEGTGTIYAKDCNGIGGCKYTLLKTGATSNDRFTGLIAGEYTIRVQDSLDCKIEKSITLHQPADIKIVKKDPVLYPGGSHVSCFNYSDGAIQVKTTGGTYPQTVSISDPDSKVIDSKVLSSSSQIVTLEGLKTGIDYSIKVLSEFNCSSKEVYTVTLTKNPAPLIISSILKHTFPSGHNVSCKDSTDGQITVKTSGGIGTHFITIINTVTKDTLFGGSFSIPDNGREITIPEIPAGSYSLILKDINGCETSQLFEITEPLPYTLTNSSANNNGFNIQCHGYTGWIKALSSDITRDSHFTWYCGNTKIGDGDIISGLLADVIYTDTVTDINGCKAGSSFTLTEPDTLQIIKLDSISPTCWYSDNGKVIYTATGGVNDDTKYTFELSGSQNASAVTDTVEFNVAQGVYNISVTDKNGCSSYSTIQITNRDTLRVLVDKISIPSCNGGDDGWIKLKAENGELISGNSYTFSLSGENYNRTKTAANAQFDSLISLKRYTYRVTDAFGCIDEGDTILDELTPLSINLFDIVENSCYNDSTASLKLKASGGAGGGYQFSYSYLTINQPFTDAEPGDFLTLQKLNWNYNEDDIVDYIIQLRDSNYKASQPSCITTRTFTLLKVRKIIDSIGIGQPLCFNTKNGNLSAIKLSGGKGSIASWDFQWIKDNTDTLSGQFQTNLGEGSYDLTITDSVGCSVNHAGINLLFPPEISVNHFNEEPAGCFTCSNGKVKYSIDNLRNSEYSLLLDGTPHDTTNCQLTGLLPGDHTIEITTYPNNCKAYDTFSITYLPPVLAFVDTFSATKGVSDGSITLRATGGTNTFMFRKLDESGNLLPDILNVTSLANNEFLITHLAKGTYRIVALDANNIHSNIIVQNLDELDRVKIRVNTLKYATCIASSDGISKVFVTGTSDYTVSWVKVSENQNIIASTDELSGVPAGVYMVMVNHAGGQLTAIDTVQALTPLELELNAVSPLCYNSATGQLGSTVSGGSGEYIYNWSTGDITSSLDKLIAGNYTLTVYDKLSALCLATKSIELTQPAPLTLKSTQENTICYSGNIAVSISGLGEQGYVMFVDGNIYTPINNTISGLMPGIHTLEISSIPNQCKAFDTVTLEYTTPLLEPKGVNAASVGASNGSIKVKATGGTCNYTFKRLDELGNVLPDVLSVVPLAGNEYMIDNLSKGSYIICATDENNVQSNSITQTITESDEIRIFTSILRNASCTASSDGVARVFVSGTNDYTVLWVNVDNDQNVLATTEELGGVPAGVYMVTIKYAGGQLSATDTIKALSPLELELNAVSPLCYNSATGQLNSSVKGGSGQYSYSWSNGSTTSSQNNLTAGNYELTVYDKSSFSCFINKSIELPQPEPLTLQSTSGNSTCYTGNIIYSITGLGGQTYSMLVDSKVYLPSNNTIQDLMPGIHTLEITTSPNQCKAYDTLTLEYTTPVLESRGTIAASTGTADGSIKVWVKGGTCTYTFNRLDESGNILPDILTVVPLAGNEYSIENLSKGTYIISATDGKNIESNRIKQVIEEATEVNIQMNILKNASCLGSSDGSAQVLISGTDDYTVSWFNIKDDKVVLATTQVISGVPAGIYKVDVSHSGGHISAIDTIRAMDSIVISTFSVLPSCYNNSTGQLISSVNGGSGNYKYLWSTGDTTFTINNIPAGSYSLTVTDKLSSSCHITKAIELTQPSPVSIEYSFEIPTCYGGKDGVLNVTPHGGNSVYSGYEWARINDGNITALQGNANILTGLQAGRYTVKVADARGCIGSDTLILPDALPISLFKSDIQYPSCYGKSDGKITLHLANGTPGYVVNWTNLTDAGQDTIASGLKGGTYYKIAVSDANGCELNDSVFLPETPLLVIKGFEYTSPKCSDSHDGAIKAFVSGGTLPYEFYWPGRQKSSTDSIAGVSAGSFPLSVKDKNLCSATTTAVLASPPALSMSTTLVQPLCFGLSNGNIIIKASGGSGTYSFYVNNILADSVNSNKSANSYTLKVLDKNGCSYQTFVTLSQPAALSVLNTILKEPVCFGACDGVAKVQVTGGISPYAILWPDKTTTSEHSGLCGGNYIVSITDHNSCAVANAVKMSIPKKVKVENISFKLPACYQGCDGEITITPGGGTSPYELLWKNGQLGKKATGLCAGDYTLTIKDINNCVLEDTITLPDQEKLSISGIPDYMKMCIGQEKELNPGLWASYIWKRNDTIISTEPVYKIKQGGTYSLNVVSSLGCTDSLKFKAEYVKDLLNADFLLSGDAIVGEDVSAIDITWPLPDTIWWIYNTDSISLLLGNNDRQVVRFNYPGLYTINLYAQTSLCYDSAKHSITVYSNNEDKEAGKRPLGYQSDIKEIFLYPNPCRATLNVEVSLNEVKNIDVEITKVVEGINVFKQQYEGSDNYKLSIDVTGQTSGVYSINITTSNQRKHFLFVILK